MNLEELLALIAAEDVEDMGAWRTQVSDGVQGLSDGFQARLAELEEGLAEAERKYNETAARNYELMTAVTKEPEETEETEETEEEKGENAINDLFKEAE